MAYAGVNITKNLTIDEIINLYKLGCKTEQNIGMEYERIVVDKNSSKSVSYYGLFGVCEMLKEVAEIDNWDYILDNNEIIGLKKLHDTITLEPGSQVELSIEPQKTVKALKDKVDEIDKVLNFVFNKYDAKLLNYGITPVSTYQNINLIPKKRYKYMADYLWGILSDVMMRETAGIQVGIDFSSEEDAISKLHLAGLISPFMTAMFANSKMRGGVDTGYKSFRALAWLNTDNDRCGLATCIGQDNSFEKYVRDVLNVPVIYFVRDNKIIYVNGKINFRQFMKDGYEGYFATLDDYKLHANMCFPDVRLRGFVEIRNHDCVGGGLEYAIPAIYKGIMYNTDAQEAIKSLLKPFTHNDINEFRFIIPKLGIGAKIKGYKVKDIALEIQKIAYQSLKSELDVDADYITPIMKLTKQGMVPADITNPLR